MSQSGELLRPGNAPPVKGRCKLLFVLPSLGGGGAERASVDLLRGMNRERFELTVALFAQNGSFLEQLPGDVQVRNLRGGSRYDFRLVWRLARLLHREGPSIIFSVLRYANLVTLLAHRLAGSKARVIVNEQNLPSAEFALFGGAQVKGCFLKRLYPQADLVTTISKGIARELASLYGLSEHKVQVIPNPVDVARVRTMGSAKQEHPWFHSGLPVLMAVGRLHAQKGFTYLIRAFAIVRNRLPCKLIILGEGPQRRNLEHLIAEFGLSDDVALPGFQANPYNYMRNSTVFILSSLYEGFGNVLVEALALGVPVISTRCPVGPDEIISDGITGLLVPPADEDFLAQAILRVLKDDELRRRLAANGPGRAADFAVERIVSQYESVFERLASGA